MDSFVVVGGSDEEKLREMIGQTYKEQAISFLNAFWVDKFKGQPENAKQVWNMAARCVELDTKLQSDGSCLDEFQAHRLLESTGGALTVRGMRVALKAAGLEFAKMVSLTELLIYRFETNWKQLVNAPQGSIEDDERISDAQVALDNASKKMTLSIEARDLSKKEEIAAVHAGKSAKSQEQDAKSMALEAKASLEAAALILENSQLAEASAVAAEKLATEQELLSQNRERDAEGVEKSSLHAEMEAKRAREVAEKAEEKARNDEAGAFQEMSRSKAADAKAEETKAAMEDLEAQLKKALDTLEREEKAFNDKLDGLRCIGDDTSKGIVTRNTAKAELAQLKCHDPMPLQRSKINQEAVVRRQRRATVSAAQAATSATRALLLAEQASDIALNSREAAEFELSHAKTRESQSSEAASKAQDLRQKAITARSEAELAAKEARQGRERATAAKNDSELAAADAEAKSKAADEAHSGAVNLRASAENARQSAVNAALAAEAAASSATAAYGAAQALLERIKKDCESAGQGSIWWMACELEKAKRYMTPVQLAKISAVSA